MPLNVMILLMRVDLRFYIPNASSKGARAIIDSGEDEYMVAEESRRQSMEPKFTERLKGGRPVCYASRPQGIPHSPRGGNGVISVLLTANNRLG